MQAMMMHRPLRIIDILTYAVEAWPDQGIISVRTEGDIHRACYPETLGRVAKLSHALESMGINLGDRVATLAWNGYRHFELYYGASAIGAVCHTINPRLSAEQLVYIINHAGDRALFIDTTFVPIVEDLRDQLPRELTFVILTDRAHMPDTVLDALCYEDLLAPHDQTFDWKEFPEDTASGLCYTSGTTGHPKGALYSHRSTVLHALMVPTGQTRSFEAGRRVMPVVPLFHVNAWGLPYTAPLRGMTMVMPGGNLDGASLFRLMDAEKVYSAWGVPTVWAGLLEEIKKQGRVPEEFDDLVVGGSAAPKVMIEDYEARGVTVSQAWGMTEMSPIGSHGMLPPSLQDAPAADRIAAKACAGRRLFGVEFKIVDDEGQRQPHDGDARGELYVRGSTIIRGYFRNDAATKAAMDAEGWFGTGDVASISPEGQLVIRDRAKDLIKSGGEWISSIDLENAAVSHPGILSCAVISIPHPKWDERPILVAVAAGDKRPSLGDLHAHMAPHFTKWQLPDDVVYVDALPLTATGKISKLSLREQFADYRLPDLREAQT
ncbi:Long-chain-fatty-acid--CoA ligase [Roseovarius litorisediminis]|uniref:Long-chain-fatty-acid--CoA ligase n=1 Tax=Roseovarius litorisediminis TaxID=1312363 RepID=A0A1Y5RRP8_9RHOB|nr:long-chain fatty acid--CoA ligase [Roseovarius litorisediminis]SLN23762.1 Long-chain-fatty-acid--CoA ligase [Roseovarius litorisediminis]